MHRYMSKAFCVHLRSMSDPETSCSRINFPYVRSLTDLINKTTNKRINRYMGKAFRFHMRPMSFLETSCFYPQPGTLRVILTTRWQASVPSRGWPGRRPPRLQSVPQSLPPSPPPPHHRNHHEAGGGGGGREKGEKI